MRVVHLVLFRPRADLTANSRAALADALVAALRAIPSIRRVRVGQRVRLGLEYEGLMPADYPYVAMFEFDDRAGLEAYLAHPAHAPLARQFFASFEETLIYDYIVGEGESGIDAIRPA